MLTRLRMGDERWHLRNRNPALRHRDDTLRHTLTAQALALVMFAGLMAFVFSDNLERVATVTLSAAMSMGIVNMATRLFLHRSPFVSQAGNWSRLLIAGLVVFPLVGLMFGGWEAELLTALSPIGSAILLSSPTSSTSAVLSAMLVAPAVLTLAAVLLWPFASKSRDQHASEIVAYDDGTVELTYDEDGQMLNPPNAEGGNSSGSVPNPV
jgi:hypothetical protein